MRKSVLGLGNIVCVKMNAEMSSQPVMGADRHAISVKQPETNLRGNKSVINPYSSRWEEWRLGLFYQYFMPYGITDHRHVGN